MAQSVRLVQWLHIVRFLQETSQGSTNLVRKSLFGIFLGHSVDRERIWKGHIMIADIEEMENLDTSEIHPRRLNATEVLTPQRGGTLLDSQAADGTAKIVWEETTEPENPLWRREQLVRSEDLREENFKASRKGSQPTGATDDAEAKRDFWSIEGAFIYWHHIEPRVQLYVPKKETYPIPLKHIDVTRAT